MQGLKSKLSIVKTYILTCTGSWEFLSEGPGDCPDISDATEIIISLEVRGRQLVGCLKNNLDAFLNSKTRGKQQINILISLDNTRTK